MKELKGENGKCFLIVQDSFLSLSLSLFKPESQRESEVLVARGQPCLSELGLSRWISKG